MKIKLKKIEPPKYDGLEDIIEAIAPRMAQNAQARREREAREADRRKEQRIQRETEKNVIRMEYYLAKQASRPGVK